MPDADQYTSQIGRVIDSSDKGHFFTARFETFGELESNQPPETVSQDRIRAMVLRFLDRREISAVRISIRTAQIGQERASL